MAEWWRVTADQHGVDERVWAEDSNEAHRRTEENLRKQGRSVPPSTEMVAEREKQVSGEDYGNRGER